MKVYGSNEDVVFDRELRHVDIEITKKCNLSCVHCSARSNVKGTELSLNETKLLLNEASSLGLENVGFTGGEPLMRKNKLQALLKYCKTALNSKTHLHTNGTMLTSEDAKAMTRLVNEITVTFLGANPKTHDGLTCVDGSFKAAEKGLHLLVRQHANVSVYMVPIKSSFKEIPQMVKRVHEIGCHRIRILSLSPTGRARDRYAVLSLNSEDRKWLTSELVETRKELGVDIDAGFCTRQHFPLLRELRGHHSCLAAENRVHIDALGEVFPCTASSGWQQLSAGNLRRHKFNLSDLWNLSPIFQFFRFFHLHPPNKCRRCALYQQCMGGCRIMMYHKYGDITMAEPDCESPSFSPGPLS